MSPDVLIRQYAALFFFAPMVQHRIKHHDFGLTESEIKKISQTAKYGYIPLIFGLLFIVIAVVTNTSAYITNTSTITRIIWLSKGALRLTIASIAVGIFLIHSDKELPEHESNKHDMGPLLLSFIPGYNRYQRYSTGAYERPYRWLKESLVWWYIIMILMLWSWTGRLAVVLIILMIARLILLAIGYDIVPLETKQWINKQRTVHVDEIRSWIHVGVSKLTSKHTPDTHHA
jgi:hypothetical protein